MVSRWCLPLPSQHVPLPSKGVNFTRAHTVMIPGPSGAQRYRAKIRTSSRNQLGSILPVLSLSQPFKPLSLPAHTAGSPGAAAATMKTGTLIAFDFDHTIVDGNTDTHVIKASPSGCLPDSVKSSYEPGRW